MIEIKLETKDKFIMKWKLISSEFNIRSIEIKNLKK